MSTILPIKAFWQYFKTLNLVGADPVWYRKLEGTDAQTVLTPYSAIDDRDMAMYPEYSVQVACWHANPDTADTRTLAVRDYFKQYDDDSSACPVLSFGTWRAQSVQVSYRGVIDSMEVTKGLLYKAVVNLTLINLQGA